MSEVRLIDANALKEHKFTTTIANGVEPVAIIDNAPTVESKRKFIRIITTEYKGKLYFSIEYEENEELRCGYTTYNMNVLSGFLRDYFFQ